MIRPPAAFVKKGGRKCCLESTPHLVDNLLEIVCEHTAGDPMQEDVVWTNLSTTEIGAELAERGTPVCPDTVRDLLKDCGFSLRQAEKTKALGTSAIRNQQFENIAALQAEYFEAGNPVISIDTKKKENLGEFHRDGQAWSNGPNRVLDHDFKNHARGVVIPHGIYDLASGTGHITLGCSHDTSQFVCDCIRLWWNKIGRIEFPHSTSILAECDAGGSNNCRHYIFKEDLQNLVDELGIEIRVAHYPPYCSKYNPIEHRLFPHVTRALSGIVFRSLEVVKQCVQRTHTSTGLTVTVEILDKTYELKRKASQEFKNNMPLKFHNPLPLLNYTAVPRTT
jgi:hypothetical protein